MTNPVCFGHYSQTTPGGDIDTACYDCAYMAHCRLISHRVIIGSVDREIESKKSRFGELSEKVLEWADDKGILAKATQWDQAQKMREEALELADECLTEMMTGGTTQPADMETGDVFVTLIILCRLRDVDPMDCIEKAYNKISKREGQMVGGFFVKQEDL